MPAMKRGELVEIVLDGTRGYPSSFLEEAFGGLIRSGFAAQKINSTFKFVANEPGFSRFIELIQGHISRASQAYSNPDPAQA